MLFGSLEDRAEVPEALWNLTTCLDWDAVKANALTKKQIDEEEADDEEEAECHHDAHAYMATLEVLIWLAHERGCRTGPPSCTRLGATNTTVHVVQPFP